MSYQDVPKVDESLQMLMVTDLFVKVLVGPKAHPLGLQHKLSG